MIGYLRGDVKFLFDDSCILDVGGVGYKIFVDTQTRQALTVGAAEEFFIHTSVKEDAINLFGFKNQSTLDFFELLLTVNGIGAKSALSVVASLSAKEFARAVTFQDLKTLTRLPGIGKKTAERILLELKGKVQSLAAPSEYQAAPIHTTTQDDAADALEALGYTTAEIYAALEKAPKNSTTEQLIKFALKEFSKGR